MLLMKFVIELTKKIKNRRMKTTEKEYWNNKKIGKSKIHILSIGHFREVLWDYQPSMIWLDAFNEDIPYINGTYADGMFNGTYTKQSMLSFDLNSLSQLESVFKDDMYIYV